MPADSPSSLGAGDQPCNECKRRKNRCDKGLPECGACARNKRHCLYERLGKTPLTRRYLTEVEMRLRQTESRLKEAEQRVRIAEARLQTSQSLPVPDQHGPTTFRPPDNGQGGQEGNSYFHDTNTLHTNSFAAAGNDPHHFPASSGGAATADRQQASNGTQELFSIQQVPPQCLEYCPSGLEDFSWDERYAADEPSEATKATNGDVSPGVADGMASLSVDDRRAGYLGVASGAAMLRLLLPVAGESRERSTTRSRTSQQPRTSNSGPSGWIPTPIWHERRIYEIDLNAGIDAYFALFHVSYPIVCESTFRAEYAQVIPRPSGKIWNALAYMVAAIGLLTSATEPVVRDMDLFEAAKANLEVSGMEIGNITHVQVLSLIANYTQKRGKPNSGYNYIGLALHMAMGLGLHKEFQNWQIAPLQMETRRRVWWTIYCFYVGAAITFGRPLAWPTNGIEVALPLNVNDEDLTDFSVNLPPPRAGLTTHSAVADQARFHLMTNEIYTKVLSVPFPSAQELLQLDEEHISTWHSIWAKAASEIDHRFTLSRNMMEWRYRNLRIIMFRPFVIRKVLKARLGQGSGQSADRANHVAFNRCMSEAKLSIESIDQFWVTSRHNCMTSWYVLFFLFQAAMIPCLCLRNEPNSDMAADWREQLNTSLRIMQSMFAINPPSRECYDVVQSLCSDYLHTPFDAPTSALNLDLEPVEESPNTQIEGLYSMMWPGADTSEIDMLIENDDWNSFITNQAG